LRLLLYKLTQQKVYHYPDSLLHHHIKTSLVLIWWCNNESG